MKSGSITDHTTSIGNIDVTKKADLEKLVKQIEEKEKCIHLLGMSMFVAEKLTRLTRDDSCQRRYRWPQG
jgi:hypothetical protein